MGISVDAPDVDVEAGTPIAWRVTDQDGVETRVQITARAGGQCDAEMRIGTSRSPLCDPGPLGEVLPKANLSIALLLGPTASDGQGHVGEITEDELIERLGQVHIVSSIEDTFFGGDSFSF